jgi:hypothetical protein
MRRSQQSFGVIDAQQQPLQGHGKHFAPRCRRVTDRTVAARLKALAANYEQRAVARTAAGGRAASRQSAPSFSACSRPIENDYRPPQGYCGPDVGFRW